MGKKSVRKEFDRIKSEFDDQLKQGLVPAKTAILFKSLITLMSVLISIFMEKNTKKTSNNSGVPPSQSDETQTSDSTSSKKSNGKKNDSRANNTRTVVSTETIELNECPKCGQDLTDVQCKCTERRTQIDIVFETTVTHFDAEIKDCPNCNKEVKATFPDEIAGPLQYGNGIKSYVINLLVAQMVSLRRTVQLLYSMTGKKLSEATLLGWLSSLYLILEPWETQAKEALLSSSCINVDETSLKVDKKNYWIHVYSSGDLSLKLLHRKRGKEAINDFGIIPKYGGTIVHDCWASYLSYEHCDHGLCGAHLLRELQFIYDSNEYRWANNMRRLLLMACSMVNALDSPKAFIDEQYQKLERLYNKILCGAAKEMPPITVTPQVKKGKTAKSQAHNLCDRLMKYQCSVLLFAKRPEVPFTNNRAERDLRMSKVKQKVSGCFRSEKYAHAFCRISSYLKTMEHKGIDSCSALEIAFQGKASLYATLA